MSDSEIKAPGETSTAETPKQAGEFASKISMPYSN
jgi:hypothetical protein